MTKTTKKAEPKKASHRQWLYKGDDAKLFNEGDEIPAGYKDTLEAK